MTLAPSKLEPDIVMTSISQPLVVDEGPMELWVGQERYGNVDGSLSLRWLPSTALEMEGVYTGPPLSFDARGVTLRSARFGTADRVLLTHLSPWPTSRPVRGILSGPLTVGELVPCERLRFSLVNFPEYLGSPVTTKQGGRWCARMSGCSEELSWNVDAIDEVTDLRRTAAEAGGFLISHVGELRPRHGELSIESAQSLIHMLHWFFGFLRGAWTGPIFPRGCEGDTVRWRQFSSWKIDEPARVHTWLPRTNALDLSPLFQGFSALWSDANWREALVTALGWFVAANASRAPNETRLVLAQIALELLAWTWLVETRATYHRRAFGKLKTAERIRALLCDRGIPLPVPDHLGELVDLLGADVPDGPALIVTLRNALVHSGDNDRLRVHRITGTQLHLAGQLALQYFELVLLALCGYREKYVKRGFRGWRGADECLVPWHS